jgi:hypothetical protein
LDLFFHPIKGTPKIYDRLAALHIPEDGNKQTNQEMIPTDKSPSSGDNAVLLNTSCS